MNCGRARASANESKQVRTTTSEREGGRASADEGMRTYNHRRPAFTSAYRHIQIADELTYFYNYKDPTHHRIGPTDVVSTNLITSTNFEATAAVPFKTSLHCLLTFYSA